jgi:branched-chain amino acid aminotransferase
MSIDNGPFVWFDGKFVRWQDANVHVSTHALHYGSSVFEGIRAYETKTGTAIFRLEPHVKRMVRSCKLARIVVPWSEAEIATAIQETVGRNGQPSCYIRPLVFRGAETMGVQYVNNQLAKMEAAENGFAEALVLDTNGFMSEGSGENLFAVLDGVLYTAPVGSSILAGVTRSSVIQLAKDQGIEVCERSLTRDAVYLADEIFVTGTAAEITPIRSVDRLTIGEGTRGPITKALQEQFFGIVSGQLPDRHGWLTPVKVAQAANGD